MMLGTGLAIMTNASLEPEDLYSRTSCSGLGNLRTRTYFGSMD